MTLHVNTPTIRSTEFSLRTGLDVLLKLESVQPCGSFKLRGVGHACEALRQRGARRLVSSSGGNAGYAVAYAGRQLGMPVTVVVPETTSEKARNLIASEGALVLVQGGSWQEANAHAQTLLDSESEFIHPFDHPLLWEGHASMIDELAQQCGKPDAIICSVGGGGLLAGIGEGLLRHGWTDVGLLAVETAGMASYAAALQQGRPTELPKVTGLATSLGARQVCDQSVALARKLPVRSHVVTDAQAVRGCADLLAAHRLLTEPACGASIAGLDSLRQHFPGATRVAVIVCGGVGVTADLLQEWVRETQV